MAARQPKTTLTVQTKVFRELLIPSLHFGPPPPPCLLGIARFGAHDWWWAHDSGCAWTAAWLAVRGRTFLGPRELLVDPEWSGPLSWFDRHSFKRSGHRPDLVGLLPNVRIAIEVELAPKSKPRLDAILNLHLGWIIRRKTNGAIYICGDHEACNRIEKAGERVGLYPSSKRLRIETLDTIKTQTSASYEQARTAGEAAAA